MSADVDGNVPVSQKGRLRQLDLTSKDTLGGENPVPSLDEVPGTVLDLAQWVTFEFGELFCPSTISCGLPTRRTIL